MPVTARTRRFTVAEYYRMSEAGILRPDERVELIEGEIIAMAAIGSPHAAAVGRLTELLMPAVRERGMVRVQQPVRISDLSEPEPDVAVVRRRPDHYEAGHPEAADMLLAVEVADTTVDFDRDVKAPLYALAGIREYWIVNIPAGEINVYREPGPSGYHTVRRYRHGDVLHPIEFPDLSLAVADILR